MEDAGPDHSKESIDMVTTLEFLHRFRPRGP